MPDEPNKKMDEMLRAYAKERRKAPDLSLHPATRNMLQGEVKKVFGSSQSALPWWRRLRAFWPQFAFAGGLCLVFGIAVLSLRQPSRTVEEGRSESGTATQTAGKDMSLEDLSKQMKKQEQTATPQEGAILPETITPAREEPPAERRQLRNLEQKSADEPKLKERVATQNAPPRTAQRLSVGREPEIKQEEEQSVRFHSEALADAAAADSRDLKQRTQSRANAPAPSISPKSATAAEVPALRAVADEQTANPVQVRARGLATAEPLARADQLSAQNAARRLNFVQVSNAPVVAGAPVIAAPSTVLTSFQMEQSGTNLRVLDRDGSIYLGALQPTNGTRIVGLKADKEQTENTLAYFFQVQGKNRTLNSDVVLTGNYFEQTNPAPAAVELFAITPAAATGQQNGARQQSQTRHFIIGNAVVGSTNQVPVHAVSTSP